MMEEAPPPPYSETDVFSHPGISPEPRVNISNDDATSVTDSSTHGSPVYTPPETPRESHFSFPAIEDYRSIASAHSYFESRPAPLSRSPGQNLVISLAITEGASPEDFPYPAWASEHDTTEQDWQTFLNYLLPDHAIRSNSQTIDRKLQAEDDAQSSKAERSIAEAQLGQIKSSSGLPLRPSHDIDAMVREWNDGFFGPRGVTVQRTPYSSRSVPETSSAEDPPTSVPQPESQSQSQSQPQPQPQGQASRPRWNPFRPFDVSSRGIRIGRLSVDDERVSFGDSFEVDRNGVRWNGLSTNDLRFESDNGNRGEVPRGPGLGPINNFPPGRGGFDNHPMGRGRPRHWWRTSPQHAHPHPYGPRNHSPGARSSASSSSSSSSNSDSSIGSLPDWDDLRDSQLPVAKQSISAWLAHPEQPMTKAMLRAARSDIKAARNAPPPTDDPGWDVSKQALRQEVRSLLARLKDLKREQKKASRAARRERREQKRALKRERKDRRRESRDARHADRHARRAPAPAPMDPFHPSHIHAHRGGGGGFTHSVIAPQISRIPQVPQVHVPPVPAIPPIPGPHFGAPNNPFGVGVGVSDRNGSGSGRSRSETIQAAQRQERAELAREEGAREAARARAQIDSMRAFVSSEAARARLEAQRNADAARAHAEAVSTQAAAQAARSRMEAQAASEAARAQAAAAVAAATAGLRYTQPQQQQRQQQRGWNDDGGHSEGVDGVRGEGFDSGNGNGSSNGNGDKYVTADALEAQIGEKKYALTGLHDTILLEHWRAVEAGEEDVNAKSKTEAELEAEKLEEEIDELRRDVQRLRLEADEEMARKMAEEEGW
ncbi:uncharacterized protein F4807DRAFT_399745 [Annulohypoxylon truncatum]|uniref:uncharacterized protein n=1 Tax=Annulohypoxylon truncatum TaxID=327061 RepID=UPI002007BC46|nr:uncharacterized protein F4807DRAFT_399745 [Annulohypoxylon truncatum]KAI1211720.1 hypothetical protein F4807DRAFT_399745 [Annulohypoxylon truncatum]